MQIKKVFEWIHWSSNRCRPQLTLRKPSFSRMWKTVPPQLQPASSLTTTSLSEPTRSSRRSAQPVFFTLFAKEKLKMHPFTHHPSESFAVGRLLFFDWGQRGEAAEAAGVQHAERPVQGGGGDSQWSVGRGGQVGDLLLLAPFKWSWCDVDVIAWSSLFLSFSLGCGIGYGYLHRIPTRPVLHTGCQSDVGPVEDSAQDSTPTSPSQPAVDSGNTFCFF